MTSDLSSPEAHSHSPHAAKHAGPTVGIVGAGQLARMGWQAAISLDLELLCLGAAGEAAAGAGAPLLEGSGYDAAALAELANRSQVLTFEHELVNLPALAELEASGALVRPSTAVLALAVDKLHQRETLSAMEGVLVPAYARVTSLAEIESFAAEHGWPVVLKARSGGYDGRGVWICAGVDAARRALEDGHAAGLELYVEQAVEIAIEVAVIVARSPSGEVAVHPPVETNQVDGMCSWVVMPARITEQTGLEVETLARNLAHQIGLEGLMAIELFLARDGRLLVNELALRTHNTGHLHTEASTTSQFEQHLRAVLDLPLGVTTPLAAAAMVNVVGPQDGSDPASHLDDALRVPGASIHLYGKSARPGRKLGHVTVCAATPEDALALAREAADRLERDG
ncbi:MAG TPA: 5-(carboxyamino)imidazole ribonucleotide synthase [Solirubrobacteraceae bacterium]|jgi:5-(carboxyamino)imidazole ribonucleotide synthase|nr:5-(carboxyamino)imidazole ribonucleotide synthase [Solirubrobacteraceae bacterium]